MICIPFYISVCLFILSGHLGQARVFAKRSPYQVFVAPEQQRHQQRYRPRILNGEEAQPHEFPFMAMLTESDGWQYCGASLIDANWALTAAHCVEGSQADQVFVRLGSHNKYYPTEIDQVHPVDEIIVHENFIAWNLTNDIALLHFAQPAQLTQEVFPICIYHADHSFKDEPLLTMGWGTKNVQTGETSDVLLKLDKTGLANNDCRKVLEPTALDHAIYEGSLCAYGGGDGKDVCFGDSGSPLVWKDWYGNWRQVGLTSWGLCATEDVPAVYTRVSHFFDWILQNANGAAIC